MSTTPRKVLFLDVDGVLNMWGSGGLFTLNKNRLKLLKEIVEKTNCEIVLSSTWRKSYDHVRKLNNSLKYRGMKISSFTPISNNGHRGTEIQTWLDEPKFEGVYAIVDDDSDMLNSQLRNFFQTDGKYGLTPTIVYRIITHLNG